MLNLNHDLPVDSVVCMIPNFDQSGNLPIGIYQAALEAIRQRFGQASHRRVALTNQLHRVIDLARSTGHLRQVFIWGSYVTNKITPGDIDLLLVMSEDFDSDNIAPPVKSVFDASSAQNQFNASILWITERTEQAIRDLILEQIQTRRDQGRRGIVEVIL